MDKFTASNGLVLVPQQDGSVSWKTGWIPAKSADALREFFVHERDAELGRWRSKKHQHWTAVLDKPAGIIWFRHENGLQAFEVRAKTREYGQWGPELREVAAEYFAAHPEPKPWHDAKPGEVWLLMFPKSTQAWFVNGDYFQSVKTLTNIAKTDAGITAARRIFPEVSDD